MSQALLGPNEDFLLQFNAMKIEGDIHLEFKDFKAAMLSYKKLKSFCEDKRRFREKIVCYGQLGYVHSLLDEQATAIKYFHKMLELAWEQGD